MKNLEKWYFWIDVGGTFTDCVGRSPDGRLHYCKVLSSGVVKGAVGKGSSRQKIVDENCKGAAEQFYSGYTLSLVNARGEILDQIPVDVFDHKKGVFILKRPCNVAAVDDLRYELTSGEVGPLLGMRRIMGIPFQQPILNTEVRLGTTAGTNALLERKGAEVIYLTTRGFADLLEIGSQARPELFNLNIVKPQMLYHKVVEIDERVAASGAVLKPLDEDEVRSILTEIYREGHMVLAIALLNAIWYPAHEEQLARIAGEIGFQQISVSHQLAPGIKLLNRGDTTVVDAYLSPVIQRYVAGLRRSIPAGRFQLMTSAGGLVEAGRFSGKDSLLSGPAGGVVGCADVAGRAGFSKAIAFDMGGTSTDVSRFDGEYEYQFSAEKAGVRIAAPMYAIETVAAGGGSICRYNDQRLLVGPESAGANPGPACYGRGGPLTITDINFFNGKIDAAHFPFPLDRDAVITQLTGIAEQIKNVEQQTLSLSEIADGFTRVANLKMANAIKRISAARGYDPQEYLLVAFGGAGAQHACAIARQLGIRQILLHPLAGILSAYGIGMADVRRFAEKTILTRFEEAQLDGLRDTFQSLAAPLIQEILAEGIPREQLQAPVYYLDLRYQGEDACITLRKPDEGSVTRMFEQQHQQLYGYLHQDRPLELVAVRVEVVGKTQKPDFPTVPLTARCPAPVDFKEAYFETARHSLGVFRRELLQPGDQLRGPAMITEAFSTIIVDPGWSAAMTERSDILLTDQSLSKAAIRSARERDPVQLALFNHLFAHIATQMGVTLQKTALSVNVKERLDFSCAILDASGELVVNAPHIPVHLGAMGETVKGIISDTPGIVPGTVFLSNDPDLGGSHLPDLTVITPVFDEDGKELRFFCASRAHHAEIGGVRPGSAYPFSRTLAEEGVVIRNLQIVKDGKLQEKILWDALTAGPYPSRSPAENVADIRAAIAANQLGARELQRLIRQHSWEVVGAYMQYIRDAATEKIAAALKGLQGEYAFHDALDDNSPIQVKITIAGEGIRVDFSGSAPLNTTSLNANRAVVQSALIYCLRCLIREDIPLNSGILTPVTLVLPEGLLNPPRSSDPSRYPAVFGGNVEVSQRIVDVILGALKVAAASQGTMNNFIFGNKQFGYYETICGGSGAGDGFNGASAVHTHMTNTRLTDVEILEKRYPVRVGCFQIRKGSGGKGQWRGGDGVIREIEFLAPMEVSLLTQRRTLAPFGLKDGAAGARGENALFRKGVSEAEELPSLAQLTVQAGDIIKICTPGGGGYSRK